MINREQYGYDLPPVGDKTTSKIGKAGKAGKAPVPMADRLVKGDWHGLTREELIQEPNLIPDYARKCPRAYLVPPRNSHAQKKSISWKDNESKKRMRDESLDTPASTKDVLQYPLPLFFPQQTHSQFGKVMRACWNLTYNCWELEFDKGSMIREPTRHISEVPHLSRVSRSCPCSHVK